MNPPADCLRCGVCCFSNSPTFVRVTGDDWSRLGPDAEQLAQFVGPGHRAFMRMRDGHCTALELRPLEPGAGGDTVASQVEYFCTIYERRPQICRDLARGSPACEGERATKTESQLPVGTWERRAPARHPRPAGLEPGAPGIRSSIP